jgi:hypothetical protein
MKDVNGRLTLVRPARYQIKVPGDLSESWTERDDRLAVAVERDADGGVITTLTGIIDQAALHGLLRRLYGQGVPLISLIWVEGD